MKDKLRDYADRLERGEPWMHKGAKFTKWIKEVVSDMRNDADKIDAEGDGGAVPVAQLRLRLDRWDVVGIHGAIEKLHLPSGEYPLYIHPQTVRSGVVSDEQVEAAWARAATAREYDEYYAIRTKRDLRIAINHFIKSQGESNV